MQVYGADRVLSENGYFYGTVLCLNGILLNFFFVFEGMAKILTIFKILKAKNKNWID